MNSTSICGMNPRTEPTPPTMPSSTSELTMSEAPAAVSQPSTTAGMDGIAMPKSSQPSPKTSSLAQTVPQSPTVETAM